MSSSKHCTNQKIMQSSNSVLSCVNSSGTDTHHTSYQKYNSTDCISLRSLPKQVQFTKRVSHNSSNHIPSDQNSITDKSYRTFDLTPSINENNSHNSIGKRTTNEYRNSIDLDPFNISISNEDIITNENPLSKLIELSINTKLSFFSSCLLCANFISLVFGLSTIDVSKPSFQKYLRKDDYSKITKFYNDSINSLPKTNSNETEHHVMNGIKLKDKDMISFCPSMKTILRNYHSFRLIYKEALQINPSPSIYFLYQNFYDLKRRELKASKKLNNKLPTDTDHLSSEDNTSTSFSVATKDTLLLEVNTLPKDKTTKRKRANDLPTSKKLPKISISSRTDGTQNSSSNKKYSSSNDTLSEAITVDSSSTSPDETNGKLTKAKSKSKTGGGNKTYVIQPSVHRHSTLHDLPPHDIKVTNDMLMRNHVASLIHSPNFSSSNIKRLISNQRKIDKLCTKLYTICDEVKSSSRYRNC